MSNIHSWLSLFRMIIFGGKDPSRGSFGDVLKLVKVYSDSNNKNESQ